MGIKAIPKPPSDIINSLRNGVLRIPDFQRGSVWTKEQITQLLDSIYKGYPVGSFLIWRTTERLRERNPLNLSLQEPLERQEVEYLLDGQQRSLVIYGALLNQLFIGKKGEQYYTYFDLKETNFEIHKKTSIDKGKIQLKDTQMRLDEALPFNKQTGHITLNSFLVKKLGHDQNLLDVYTNFFKAFTDYLLTALL